MSAASKSTSTFSLKPTESSGKEFQLFLELREAFGREFFGAPIEAKAMTILRNGQTSCTFNLDPPAILSAKMDGARVIESLHLKQVIAIAEKGKELHSQEGWRLEISGEIFFSSDPFSLTSGFDPFSYGTATAGLSFSNLRVNSKDKNVQITEDQISVTAKSKALRDNSLAYVIPLTLKDFSTQNGAVTSQKSLTLLPLLQQEEAASAFATSSPSYRLNYHLPIGSMGNMSSDTGLLQAILTIGWGPSPYSSDEDAIFAAIDFGSLGTFNIQGILTTNFSGVSLQYLQDGPSHIYALALDDLKMKLFGYSLPIPFGSDFYLISKRATHAEPQPMAWLLNIEPELS